MPAQRGSADHSAARAVAARLLAAAATTVSRLLELAPRSGTALLYGGLIALRQRQDDLAADRLAQLRVIEPDPRFGAQVDRAFALLRPSL